MIDWVWILIGSRLPDIDNPRTKFNWLNPWRNKPGPYHRGKPHTLMGSALLCTPLLIINYNAFVMTYLGALLHIVMDRFHALIKRRKFRIKWW